MAKEKSIAEQINFPGAGDSGSSWFSDLFSSDKPKYEKKEYRPDPPSSYKKVPKKYAKGGMVTKNTAYVNKLKMAKNCHKGKK